MFVAISILIVWHQCHIMRWIVHPSFSHKIDYFKNSICCFISLSFSINWCSLSIYEFSSLFPLFIFPSNWFIYNFPLLLCFSFSRVLCFCGEKVLFSTNIYITHINHLFVCFCTFQSLNNVLSDKMYFSVK